MSSSSENPLHAAMCAVNSQRLGEASKITAQAALSGMEIGCGAMIFAAYRSETHPELSALCITMSGKFTDDDLLRLKDYVLGMSQDGSEGAVKTVHQSIDNTNPAEE